MGIRLRYSIPISLKTAIIIAVIVMGYMLVKSFYRSGEWQVFDSNPTRYTTEYPDGYRIEYPANWKAEALKGYHASVDLRAVFRQPPSTNHRSLQIYWHSLDEMSIQDILEWGDEAMSIEAVPKATQPITQTVGLGDYLTIKKEYTHIKKQNDYQVSYIVMEGNEVFMLAFYAKEFDEQTEAIFDRMLSSFEIYK